MKVDIKIINGLIISIKNKWSKNLFWSLPMGDDITDISYVSLWEKIDGTNASLISFAQLRTTAALLDVIVDKGKYSTYTELIYDKYL